MASLNIKKAGSCYLCCDSCLRLGRESILDNRSTSLWSCTAHTPGCTLGDGCSSLPPRMSCCWSPGEAPGDKNIQPLFLVPLCTGDYSPLWPYDTYLWWGEKKCSNTEKHTGIGREGQLNIVKNCMKIKINVLIVFFI